jgi:hypothetical protein
LGSQYLKEKEDKGRAPYVVTVWRESKRNKNECREFGVYVKMFVEGSGRNVKTIKS